ncbi:DHA14-like major facilitator [Mycena sanguinolenta]|uniref:DHA14-like major facilitator n=1 Tax=Mycena sanguinolenta TaxID=230812 RepID=A0A8H6ZHA2_9AGAR|nr:DHA14-like major facilitator [Mycena sanguinolenta]
MSVQGSSQTASPTPTLREPLEATFCVVKTEESYDADGYHSYPRGLQLILVSLAMFLAIFLGSMDNSTTPTLVPRITDEFHSLADVGWYGSTYVPYWQVFLADTMLTDISSRPPRFNCYSESSIPSFL